MVNVLINGTTGDVVPPSHYGGIERANAYLVKGLRELGYNPKLLCRIGSTIDCEKIEFDHNPIDPSYALSIAEQKWGHFDVLHDSSCCGSLNQLQDSQPTFWTLHGPSINSNYTAYLSKGSMPYYADGGLNPPYTHFGIDLSIYPPCFDKEDYILFIGQGTRDRKYLHYFTAVAHAHNLHAIAVIPHTHIDQQYFNECMNQHPFTWVDGANDQEKVKLLQGARAVVHCSEMNGWVDASPAVVLESMACGTPVIGNYSGGIPEMIQDGVNGFLVHNEQEAIDAYSRIGTIDNKNCRDYMEKYRTHTLFAKRMSVIYEAIANVNGYDRHMRMMSLQEEINAVTN